MNVFNEGFISTGDGHDIYFQQCGNPHGDPVLFVHGGPGVGASEKDKVYFDLKEVNLILFVQRGSGKSLPKGKLKNNTTRHIVGHVQGIKFFKN